MRKKLLISGAVILVILAGFFFVVTNGLSEGANIALSGISLEGVADGTYMGVYDFKRWSNTVEVKVIDGKIATVSILNDVPGAGITHCSDEVICRVIAAQNTQVDTVSGATVTSKAYLKAIEDALKQREE